MCAKSNNAPHTIVFRRKRSVKDLLCGFGGLLMAGCAAGVIVLIVSSIVADWPRGHVGLLTIVIMLLTMVLSVAIGLVMLFGIVFFGGFGLYILKDFFQSKNALKLLPDGICGETSIEGVDLIPWKCIEFIRLETNGKRMAIGIHTTVWPPIPMWQKCSSDVRRMLWRRHNRRQTPFYLYIDDVAAPPEEILRTIETELAHARERADAQQ